MIAFAFCAASIVDFRFSCEPFSPPSVSSTRIFRPASCRSFSFAARYTASYSSVPRGVPFPVIEPVPAPVLITALSIARRISRGEFV